MRAATAAAASGLSDMQLAERVAQRDEGAFEKLMRRHHRVLYRAARSILKDDAEAEDALQDGYLSAFRAISDFRGEAKLSTWLVRIVVNAALARLRKRAAAAQVEEQSESAPEQPDHAAQRAQTRRVLEAKIDLLPDAFRAVFALRALQELSVAETAVSLDIPQATVRTRFFRARSQLRKALCQVPSRRLT